MPIDEIVDPGLKAILTTDVNKETKAMLVYRYCKIHELHDGDAHGKTMSLDDYLGICKTANDGELFYLRDAENNLVPFKRSMDIIVPASYRIEKQ